MILFCGVCGHQKKEYTSFTSKTWECTNENCGKPKEQKEEPQETIMDVEGWYFAPYYSVYRKINIVIPEVNIKVRIK